MKIKFVFFTTLLLFVASLSKSEVTGSFVVAGNINNYYPVTFYDGGFSQNVATELTIGRSGVHQDATWRGAIIAKFKYHVTNWGNDAQFIDGDIHQNQNAGIIQTFVGGWQDITPLNGDTRIVIWLRGGTTTYYYNANYTVSPVVYDGVANALPYNITNGGTLTFKTSPDVYVNQKGPSFYGPLYSYSPNASYFSGNIGIGTSAPAAKLEVISATNSSNRAIQVSSPDAHFVFLSPSFSNGSYNNIVRAGDQGIVFSGGTTGTGSFCILPWSTANSGSGLKILGNGNVGIGTATPSAALDVQGGNVWINGPSVLPNFIDNYALNVNGNIRANKLVVNTTGADFVFEPTYNLLSLNQLETYVATNRHLPGIETANAMQKDGVDVGDNQTKLLQKIEELTLYAIAQDKQSADQKKKIASQDDQLQQLQLIVLKLQQQIDDLKAAKK